MAPIRLSVAIPGANCASEIFNNRKLLAYFFNGLNLKLVRVIFLFFFKNDISSFKLEINSL